MKYNYNKGMNKSLAFFPLFRILFGFLSCLVFLSCSKAEPKIVYGFMELAYYPGRDKPDERYIFFIIPEDDDGIENLSELYLYYDREGLRWLIQPEDWIQYEEEGRIWIGSRNIAMTEDAPLPRGQYRAVLVNKGGEKTERRFTFDGPEESPYPFPFLSISDGVYRIDSQYPVNSLVCYDQQGRAVQNATLPGIQGNIRDLRLSNSIRTAALWAEDPEYHISALTEAVPVR